MEKALFEGSAARKLTSNPSSKQFQWSHAVITNSGDDFTVSKDGMEMKISSGDSIDRERAYTIVDGSGNVKGYLWGTTLDNTIRLVSEDNLVLESKGGDILIGSNGDTTLSNPNGDVILQSLPNFDPGISGVIYRSGNDLRISTG